MSTGVTRLKELLFDDESQQLADVRRRLEAVAERALAETKDLSARQADLARRVDTVFDRTGTEERLQKSVAAIIDGALREAEKVKHDDLAKAVAPLIVRTIRQTLKDSQDEMVDALYPITGQLVKQYVAAAIADLTADINKKLGGGAKTSELEERAKALGVTVSALVMAETQALKVDELFLVKRHSGDLVAHWERPTDGAVTSVGADAGSNRDVLIANYLSGITKFSEEAFDELKGRLRSMDMSGSRLFVRASPAYLLAARCSGNAPAAVERIIDDEFVRVLGAHQDALAFDAKPEKSTFAAMQTILPDLAGSFEQRFAETRLELERKAAEPHPKPSFARLYALASLLLLPILAFIGWTAWTAWERSRVESTAQRVVTSTAELAGYPISFDIGSRGHAMTVVGLVPNEAARDRLVTRLKADLPETAVAMRLAVLPRPVTDLAPEDALRQFARLHAVFFANGVDLLDTTRSAPTLDRLANLIADTRSLVRIVGYTDERGQGDVNTAIAFARAERIADLLAERGVPRARLVVLGRQNGFDVSRQTGTGSPNRRVEFEVGFIGEGGN